MSELRNQTDTLVYSTERPLAEHGAKPSEGDRNAIEQALGEAREALKAEDIERIRQAQENPTGASHTLAEAMYRDSRGGTAGSPRGSGSPKGGEVVDAEFEDADER
jgi:molecular chaperone DnaK